MKLKLEANGKARKAREARKAKEASDLSGAALRRGLDQDILDRHPGLTQAELDEFMNEA